MSSASSVCVTVVPSPECELPGRAGAEPSRPRSSFGRDSLAHTLEQGVDYVTRVVRDYLVVAWVVGRPPAREAHPRSRSRRQPWRRASPGVGWCRPCRLPDRFRSVRDEARNRAVYTRLRQSLSQNLVTSGAAHSEGSIGASCIEHRTDLPIERAAQVLPGGSFDVILYRAVLEHVYDLGSAWRSMDTLLAADGIMLHKVDFQNHGMYGSLHPLRFLGVPESLWRWVSRQDPTLNRQRLSVYERLAAQSGYELDYAVTHLSSRDTEFTSPRISWQEGEDYTSEDIRFIEDSRRWLGSTVPVDVNERFYWLTASSFVPENVAPSACASLRAA